MMRRKKGYSGVALYCRQKPDEVIVGMGNEEFDAEGRYIEAKFGNLSSYFTLYAIRILERRTSASQIPLHGSYDGKDGRDESVRS